MATTHINRLRRSAIADLERVCPAAHYWLREYDPKADRELVEPFLMEPGRFGLTLRELDAANALSALADFEIRSRAIWSAAFPARDIDTQEIEAGTSEQQDREISARYEVFRRVALVYANAISDPQLIEAFQPMTHDNQASETGPERDKRLYERRKALKAQGVIPFLKQIASEEGVHESAIKQATARHEKRQSKNSTPSHDASSLFGQIKSANNK